MDKLVSKTRKRKERKAKAAQKPAQNLNVSGLISKIYQFDLLEWQGKLNGDGRQHRKLLQDRYTAIRKARLLAGLETSELVPFDAEAHEYNSKQQKQQQKNIKIIQDSKASETESSSLPSLPSVENVPSSDILAQLGLPAYRICFEYVEEETN
jgi:hypothetical protein